MPHRTNVFLIFVCLFTIGTLFFAPSWTNPFVFDDIIKIQENSDIRAGANLWESLFYPYKTELGNLRNDPSRPLVSLLYKVGFNLSYGKPTAIHIFSTLIHCLNSFLVFLLTMLIIKKLFSSISLLPGLISALLFLFLPVNAGSVLYAYALSDILVTTLLLLAVYLLAKDNHITLLRYLSALSLFAFSLLTKQMAVIFPVILILTDLLLGNDIKKRTWHYAGLFAISILYVIFRQILLGGIGDLEAQGNTLSSIDYFFVQGIMILKYILISIFPFGFALDHFFLPEDFNSISKLFSWILITVLAIAALYAVWTNKLQTLFRFVSWVWLFFFFSLLPVSSLLPTVDLFVERRAYLPSVSLMCAIGIFFGICAQSQQQLLRKSAWFFVTIVVAAFAFISWKRAEVYSSPIALWEESHSLYPQSRRIQINLATAYTAERKYGEAKFILDKLIKKYPTDSFSYSKLGLILQNPEFAAHDLNLALIAYKTSLQLSPNDIVTMYNLGSLYLQMGDYSAAESLFRKVSAINPKFAYSKSALGKTLIKMGKKSEAKAYLEEALMLDPQVPGAREELGKLKQ